MTALFHQKPVLVNSVPHNYSMINMSNNKHSLLISDLNNSNMLMVSAVSGEKMDGGASEVCITLGDEPKQRS